MLLEVPLALGGLGLSAALLLPGAVAAMAPAKPLPSAWASFLGVAVGAGAFHLLTKVFDPGDQTVTSGERGLAAVIALAGFGLAGLAGIHLRLDPLLHRSLGGLGLAVFALLAVNHLVRIFRAGPRG